MIAHQLLESVDIEYLKGKAKGTLIIGELILEVFLVKKQIETKNRVCTVH